MRKIAAVAIKEFRQTWRDPLTLLMLLGVPTFMLLLYGYALNFDVQNVALAVQDRSRTAQSRDLVASFVHSHYFDLVADLPPGTDIHTLFERRRAQAVIVIPEDYARRLESHRTAEVQLLVDGSNANTAATILGYVQGIVNEINVQLISEWYRSINRTFIPPIHYEPRVWYNPELKSTQFLVPGLIAFIMMLTAVLSTALAIVREKERGTMEQLRMTSLRPRELILGKTIPYMVISCMAMAIILLAARVLFNVHIRGSYADLAVAAFLFLIGALGLGLLISSISRTQAMAWQVGSLLSMLPTIFLSGFIFPIRNMPVVLQAITYCFPARYILVIMRGVILKGASLAPYLHEMLFLTIYATLVLTISFRRLSKVVG
ncbi:MAG TPA: ABC transporter permease [Bdellovibrionota bacterium]|nr:ABC transporter permease [Bdellovibrionota bacterium]